jgi:hypothetical protein
MIVLTFVKHAGTNVEKPANAENAIKKNEEVKRKVSSLGPPSISKDNMIGLPCLHREASHVLRGKPCIPLLSP